MNIKEQLAELVDAVVEELKDRWDFYQHRLYLKRMGWTEEQYQQYNDPLRNERADRVADYYHGYPYWHPFESSRIEPFTRYATWMDAYQAIKEWCESNCKGRWRHDILRAEKHCSEWKINELGGDALFFAFENERDYVMFCLKWL